MSALGPARLRSAPSEHGTSFGVRKCTRQSFVKPVLRHPIALEQCLYRVRHLRDRAGHGVHLESLLVEEPDSVQNLVDRVRHHAAE